MKPAARRALLFAGMVTAGLAVVYLLADPLSGRKRAHIGELDAAGKDAPSLRIQDEKDDRATQVMFPGEVEFDVVQPVEGADGSMREVPAYRVKIKSGRPDASGAFVAESPFVRLLDRITGAENGTLSSNSARFETGDSVGGAVRIDLSHMNAQRFSLIGDVQGDMLMADGHAAHVTAERVDVDGALVKAPGHVTWSRDDMSLVGEDMTWDGDTGRLDFSSNATITLVESPERRGLELNAPDGLTWNLPPGSKDPRTQSWGELRGPVTGVASDGTRVAAQSLLVDGRTGTIRLVERAAYEREDKGRKLQLTAQHIALEADESGRFAIAQADGSVRLVSAPFAVLPAWMVTEHIRMQDSRVTAPGEVTWSQEGVVATGTQLDWDTAVGRLVYDREAQISVDENSEQPLAGLRVFAPGGMTWTIPPEATDPIAAAQGELRGKVSGTLPDGTSFATDMLFFDGAARAFRLEGSAQFRRVADDRRNEASAQRITLGADEHQRLALVSAEGDVVLLSGPIDVLPARLVAASMQRTGAMVTSPDEVSWSRDGVTIVGTGMVYDETTGQLDLTRDAQIRFTDPENQLTAELNGAGGLTWVAPPHATSAQDGHGELRGRVTGRMSDGSTLDTETLLVDGPSHTMTLRGKSHASLAGRDGPLLVDGTEVRVENADSSPIVTSSEAVAWSRAGMSGSGTGMRWDDGTGVLHLGSDVRISFAARTPAAEAFVLTSRGSLDWTVPPGADDALRDGFGTLRDGVEGGNDQQGRFHTELLALDGRAGTAVLEGPSSFERRTAAEHVALAATQRLAVRAAPDGTPQHLSAEGSAVGTLFTAGSRAPLHLSGDRLEADRITRTVELLGHASVQQGEGSELRSVAATELLRAVTDEHDELRSLQATGDVVCHLGDIEVRGDELAWDVGRDVALLTGHCRLIWEGNVVDAAQVEVHPRSQEARIVRSTIRVKE